MAQYVPNPHWREGIAADVREWFGDLVGEVRDDAVRGVPVDTGTLRDSVYATVDGDVGRIGTELNYGLYVEEGHRVAYVGPDGETVYTGDVVPPQPWLRPALYRNRG
ncbi:HK97 gp10 family phage protein [Amycolatopsis albispora]|uniref:Uncharacterized protein n=1 Tax=Amycolatopsis albispora TaxID=1804986 RepID=A0A344LGY5_9PSEU|nr:HK97 gp10 family phage protein [Amycolatopsis albispora]AXB47309.1 hypothetical protein A4R43_36690 [Amycolatopsis albispora]